jgi:hypothetical protein
MTQPRPAARRWAVTVHPLLLTAVLGLATPVDSRAGDCPPEAEVGLDCKKAVDRVVEKTTKGATACGPWSPATPWGAKCGVFEIAASSQQRTCTRTDTVTRTHRCSYLCAEGMLMWRDRDHDEGSSTRKVAWTEIDWSYRWFDPPERLWDEPVLEYQCPQPLGSRGRFQVDGAWIDALPGVAWHLTTIDQRRVPEDQLFDFGPFGPGPHVIDLVVGFADGHRETRQVLFTTVPDVGLELVGTPGLNDRGVFSAVLRLRNNAFARDPRPRTPQPIDLTVTAPPEWRVTLVPSTSLAIAPGAEAAVSIEIFPPARVEPGASPTLRVEAARGTAPPTALEIPLAAADGDADGVPLSIDNCPQTANSDQADSDSNGVGDACESARGLELLARDVRGADGHATVDGLVGQVSWKYKWLEVVVGSEDAFRESLGAVAVDPQHWIVPTPEGSRARFGVSVVAGPFAFTINPEPGDFRGFQRSECGEKVPGTKTGCDEVSVTVLRDGKEVEIKAWAISETRDRKVCKRAEVQTMCLETYVTFGEQRIYTDKECTKLFSTVGLSDFACEVSK